MDKALSEAMSLIGGSIDRNAPASPPEQTITDHGVSRTYVNGQLETVDIDDYYEATEWFHSDIRVFLEEKFDWFKHDRGELV